MISRRKVLELFSTLPVGGAYLNGLAFPTLSGDVAPSNNPLTPGPELFQSIGVEPVINCRGTFTIIGGSIERPEVRAAMQSASESFVQYDELAMGIGARLAALTGAEWGLVSAGCAAGLKHVTAACVTGGNPEKLIRIPDLTGFEKTEVIVPLNSRSVYDHAIRNIGVKMIMVETPEELESAISRRTALIYIQSTQQGGLSTADVSKLPKVKEWGIPIMVDAAAEDLTIPNVHLQAGASIVAYSGGKALCGPQCGGLVLGDKKILMAAWQASAPHHGPGRDNKVGREEMIGVLAAVEAWVARDHDAKWKTWLSWLDTISKRVTAIPGVTAVVTEPKGLGNKSPRLVVSWDPARFNMTGEEIAEELARNKPRIAIGGRSEGATTSLDINTGQMQPNDVKIVADRVYGVLSQKRPPKKGMAAPAATITGRWDVRVEFFNSESQHTLYIEQQDGNWLQGAHRGDFSTRDMAGTIAGNEVKLLSSDPRPGDRITYIFTGTLSGDTIAGNIFMGEYLNATFTAKRHAYPTDRKEILVPGGPPLAT